MSKSVGKWWPQELWLPRCEQGCWEKWCLRRGEAETGFRKWKKEDVAFPWNERTNRHGQRLCLKGKGEFVHLSAAQLDFQPALPCSRARIAFPAAQPAPPAVFWELGAVGHSQGQPGWPATHSRLGGYWKIKQPAKTHTLSSCVPRLPPQNQGAFRGYHWCHSQVLAVQNPPRSHWSHHTGAMQAGEPK